MSQVGDILSEIQAHVIADTSVDFDEHRVFLRYPDPREARQKPVLFIFRHEQSLCLIYLNIVILPFLLCHKSSHGEFEFEFIF